MNIFVNYMKHFFVEGFDAFYKFMIEKERSIHPLLVITYNLKKNIALTENEY